MSLQTMHKAANSGPAIDTISFGELIPEIRNGVDFIPSVESLYAIVLREVQIASDELLKVAAENAGPSIATVRNRGGGRF